MIDYNVIQEIKGRLSIEDALHQYLRKKPERKSNAKSIYIKCPFHNDKRPSFTIWPNTNTWKCWAGCGHGDVINLVGKIHSVSNDEAIHLLRKQLSLERKLTAAEYNNWKIDKELLIGFEETKEQIVLTLLSIKSQFEEATKQVTSFEDIDQIIDVYHAKPLVEKYLEELESWDHEVQVDTVKYLLPLLDKWREICERQTH